MAYSRNPFLWTPKLRREDGFVRMVSGLGTRAVQHTGEDYPRMVALSHPQLRPEAGAQQIRYYSQYYMDVLDIKGNCFKTRACPRGAGRATTRSCAGWPRSTGAIMSARWYSTIRAWTRAAWC